MWVGDEFIYISSPFSLFSSYSFHHHCIHRIHRPHRKVDYSSKRRFLPKDRAIHQDLIIYPRAQWCFHFRMTEAQFLTKDFISTHLNLTLFHIWMLVPCRYLKWIFQKNCVNFTVLVSGFVWTLSFQEPIHIVYNVSGE